MTTAVVLAAASISTNEGFRSRAYLDTRGKATIGYGRCDAGVRLGMSCSIAEARGWRDSKIAAIVQQLDPWTHALPVEKQAVLIEMAYQLGMAGLLQFKTMLSALQGRAWLGAEYAALDSDWARQTPARAQRLAAILGAPVPSAPTGRDALVAAASDHGALR